MINRSQKYTISGILTLLTVATTAGVVTNDGSSIPAQLSELPINVFGPQDTPSGINVRANEHNVVTCPAGTTSRIASQTLEKTSIRFWVYEYSGGEPAVTGVFYVSPGELAVNPHFTPIDTLREFSGGKRYYIMSEIALQFRCGEGLTKAPVCGNGVLEIGESCDLVHEGCDQTMCTATPGYVCENNVCRVHIPVLGEGGGSSSAASSDASSSQQSSYNIVIDESHTECSVNGCRLVVGLGPNACSTDTDCTVSSGSSASSGEQVRGSLSVRDGGLHPSGQTIRDGHTEIGNFRFINAATAAQAATIDSIIFTVESTNVVMDARAFHIIRGNIKAPCAALYLGGETYHSEQISGTFLVRCENLPHEGMAMRMQPGSSITLWLSGIIVDSQLNPQNTSRLQVSLRQFTDPAESFSPSTSHLRWIEGESDIRFALPLHDPVVSSTLFSR